MRTLRICSVNYLSVYHRTVSAIVVMSYVISLGLIYLITGS